MPLSEVPSLTVLVADKDLVCATPSLENGLR